MHNRRQHGAQSISKELLLTSTSRGKMFAYIHSYRIKTAVDNVAKTKTVEVLAIIVSKQDYMIALSQISL